MQMENSTEGVALSGKLQAMTRHSFCSLLDGRGVAVRISLLPLIDLPTVLISGLRQPEAPAHFPHCLALLVGVTPEAWDIFKYANAEEKNRLLEIFDRVFARQLVRLLQTCSSDIDLVHLAQEYAGPLLAQFNPFDEQVSEALDDPSSCTENRSG